jgi:hypothetical protein
MRTMNRTTGFLSFALAIGVLVVLLALMNWVPMAFQKDTLRRYRSLEEVRTALNIRDIYVPSYFPQHIVWPPSEILAQGRPFPALVMEFKDAGSGEIVLVLSQSQGGPFSPDLRSLGQYQRNSPLYHERTERRARCRRVRKNQPCSRITWKEGPYTVTALMKAAPFELTKITDSMLR